LRDLYRAEFGHYDGATFRADFMAGLAVAAVALPLALAFGVASGATAAAGLVTAIVAGLVIGALSGAPYQISGPTGAMSAILILLVQEHGIAGVWVAGMLSGVVLLAVGLLGLGRFIAFIPAPVIGGFTSGIALVIGIGQIDELLGVKAPTAPTAALQLVDLVRGVRDPNVSALVLGVAVMIIMLSWPRRWRARLPASLVGIAVAALANRLLGGPAAVIGAIPHTPILTDRLMPSAIPWTHLGSFAGPALTIAALGAVESLLCGAVASQQTGIRLAANQELIAQGAGNLLLPFAGGVPATAAIARSGVGIQAGGRTRMTGIVHALVLLSTMLVLAPAMRHVPLTALAGVLLVTAWRMNEWEGIRYVFGRRFKTASLSFLITMAATIVLDLTQAILAGALLSAAVFMNQIAGMRITREPVDAPELRRRGIDITGDDAGRGVEVAQVSGPLFFAAVGAFNEAFASLDGVRSLVLAMRGVPLVDTSGLQALLHLQERLEASGATLFIASPNPAVRTMLERGGVVTAVGADRVFPSTDTAIAAAMHHTV